ncbi:transposase [Photorhabdus temperata subsp. temperata M1021]|nr:transposase [Photorhabdus temperata subsp. temperata M1021]
MNYLFVTMDSPHFEQVIQQLIEQVDKTPLRDAGWPRWGLPREPRSLLPAKPDS